MKTDQNKKKQIFWFFFIAPKLLIYTYICIYIYIYIYIHPGITPMLQIIRAIDKNPSDQTHKSLIFGNVSVDDILLKDELDAIVNKHAVTGKFKIHYCVDKKPDDTPPDFNHSVGFITPELIEKHMPAPAKNTLILVCGPKPMVDAILKHLHDKLNYSEDMVFVY